MHDPVRFNRWAACDPTREARVRYAVVSSLGGCEAKQAIAALIEDPPTRTGRSETGRRLGLGHRLTQTPRHCEALFARLAEEDDEIRGEALVRLARRATS